MAATAEGNALTREQQDRMCRNKRKFDKEGKAIDFVIACQRRRMFGGVPARVYRCPVCAKYHVTSGALGTAPPANQQATMAAQPAARRSA